MKQRYDIAIAGAGVVGLTMASLLTRSPAASQLNIIVVDGGKPPTYAPNDDIALRVSAISSGSAGILQRADAWQRIDRGRICEFAEMRVWDAGTGVEGPETLHFSAAEFALPHLGHIVENSMLQTELLAALASQQVDVRFATTIRAIDQQDDRYVIKLSDASTLHPDLLIGADGANSFVRRQTGIAAPGRSYQQMAFVTHLRTERSHRHTAWQRFLESGPIALLPLADGRVSTVWSTTPELATAAQSASDKDLGQRLTEASDGVLGRLIPAGPRGGFPLQLRHAKQYVRPGVALIGDAAHNVHPLAGQGANLGLADAACLATVIADAIGNDEHIADYRVLRRYERGRKGSNRSMLQFVDVLNRLFSNRSRSLAELRTTGMRLFNRSGPVREHAVRVALGIGRD